MSKERIYLSPPHQTGDELDVLQKVLSSNWLAPVGPDLALFEQAICEATGFKYAVATSSGTAALHLGLNVLGVSSGDAVLASTMTFIGAINPILYQGAKPVFIDADPDSWNIDTGLAEESLQVGGLKAVVPTHLYGMPADVAGLEKLGKSFRVPLLHDLAECMAGRIEGKRIGECVTRGIFSFNGNKLITTSGGGAFVTNVKEEADHVLYLARQAKSETNGYHHKSIGYNYRMSNVLAALGMAQIKSLAGKIRKKKNIFDAYRAELTPLGFEFQIEPDGINSDRWLSCVLLPDGIGKEVNQIVGRMDKLNIEVRPLWKPMHLQPVFEGEKVIGGDVSETLFDRGLCLPSGCGLTEGQQEEVIKSLKSIISS